MIRRYFLALIGSLLLPISVASAPVPSRAKRYFEEILIGEEFTYAGHRHMRIDYTDFYNGRGPLGHFGEKPFVCPILKMSGSVKDLETGRIAWMGPKCPVNYDLPVVHAIAWSGR